MGEDKFFTGRHGSDYLDVTESWVNKYEKLMAKLQNAPVQYYLIDRESLEDYKKTPKRKGGRPRKKKST